MPPIENYSPLRPLVNVPSTQVTEEDGSYTVHTADPAAVIMQVRVADDHVGLVQLPDNRSYRAGEVAYLTAWQYEQVSQASFDGGVLEDEGPLDIVIGAITITGAATVTDAATLQLGLEAESGMEVGDTADDVDVADDAEWSSSDETVATVDDTGLVTGVSAGTATITARVGHKETSHEVTVTAA